MPRGLHCRCRRARISIVLACRPLVLRADDDWPPPSLPPLSCTIGLAVFNYSWRRSYSWKASITAVGRSYTHTTMLPTCCICLVVAIAIDSLEERKQARSRDALQCILGVNDRVRRQPAQHHMALSFRCLPQFSLLSSYHRQFGSDTPELHFNSWNLAARVAGQGCRQLSEWHGKYFLSPPAEESCPPPRPGSGRSPADRGRREIAYRRRGESSAPSTSPEKAREDTAAGD